MLPRICCCRWWHGVVLLIKGQRKRERQLLLVLVLCELRDDDNDTTIKKDLASFVAPGSDCLMNWEIRLGPPRGKPWAEAEGGGGKRKDHGNHGRDQWLSKLWLLHKEEIEI